MKHCTLLKSLLLLAFLSTTHAFTALAQIANLAVDGGIFSAAFDPNVTAYDVKVPAGTDNINVVAFPANTLTTISGTGSTTITGGTATATVTVSGGDLAAPINYILTITTDATVALGYVVTNGVDEELSGNVAYTLVDFTPTYWTGDTTATLSQYPTPTTELSLAGQNFVILKAEKDGAVETKLLPLKLSLTSANGPLWNGGESNDFFTAANWDGSVGFSSYKNYYIGQGENPCVFTGNPANYSKHFIANHGELYITKDKLISDRMTIKEGGLVTVENGSELNIYKSLELSGGTITVLDSAIISYRSGSKYFDGTGGGMTVNQGIFRGATINIFGGAVYVTKKMNSLTTSTKVNMKDGGIAYFASSQVITDAVSAGIITPEKKSLLVFEDNANWISSITLHLPEGRYEVLDADGNFTIPDYAPIYAQGDSIHNISYTQTPAAGTVFTTDNEVVSVVVEATDFFSNVISDTVVITVRKNSNVWRGNFSENYADSANWEGSWPIAEWSEIFIDKTNSNSFDPIFTSGVQWGELVLAPENTLYINGGECKPNDPVTMDKTSSIIINGGVLNIRENAASAINNGTITLLAHKDGYAWSEFDHKAAFTFATNIDDEFTFNAWGGEAGLKNITLGAGKVSITLKDDGAANFNDSTLVATALASGVISAIEGFHLSVNANYTQVRADSLVSIDKQVGLVDDNDNYSIPDFTSLATYAATNTITVTQSPLKDAVVNGVGIYTVTLTATDAWGNASTIDFDLELINYVVDCPVVSTLTDANPTDSVIIPDYTADASTRGLWSTGLVISQFPLAGDTVALDSIFEVTITAIDDALQTNFCKFTVTVIDTTVPVIAPMADQILTLESNCRVKIPDYTTIVEVSDVCHKDYIFTQIPAAGTQLIGVGDAAVVNILVADGNGNVSDTLIFTTIAADLTNPVVTKAFGNHSVRANADCEAILRDYTTFMTVEDNCSSDILLSQTPDAGTVLAGDGDSVLVTVTIDDQNGNKVDTAWVVKLSASGCSVDSNSDKNIVLVTNDDRDSEQQTWLVAQGFNVTTYYSTALGAAPQEEIDALNAADLVIIGRSVASNDFGSASADDKLAWNALTVPVIANSQWIVRSTKLNWFNSATATHDNNATETLMAVVSQPTDDVFEFANVSATDSLVDWFTPPFDYIDNATAATNGTVLASYSTYPLYVRFTANTEFYPTSVDMPAAARTYFGFGNDNVGGVAYFFPLTNNAKAVYYAEIRTLLGMPVEVPTSVDGVVNADASIASLSVYPSPASTSITIDASGLGEDVVISIVDMQGKVVTVVTDITSKVSIEALKAGIYMVKAVSSSDIAVAKFIKK